MKFVSMRQMVLVHGKTHIRENQEANQRPSCETETKNRYIFTATHIAYSTTKSRKSTAQGYYRGERTIKKKPFD